MTISNESKHTEDRQVISPTLVEDQGWRIDDNPCVKQLRERNKSANMHIKTQ